MSLWELIVKNYSINLDKFYQKNIKIYRRSRGISTGVFFLYSS